MVTKDQALKLALEALEFDGFTPEDATHRLLTVKATAKCKEALAHPWPDLTEQQREAYQKGHNDGVAHHKQAIKAAQPEREPVATTYKEVTDAMNLLLNGDYKQFQMAQLMADAKLYTTPPTREWVALTDEPEQGENTKQRVLQLIKELRPAIAANYHKDLSTPQKREWVELTLTDREALRDKFEGWNYPAIIVDAISDILKEKNK